LPDNLFGKCRLSAAYLALTLFHAQIMPRPSKKALEAKKQRTDGKTPTFTKIIGEWEEDEEEQIDDDEEWKA
jgi:hypothetical protein